LVENIVMTVRDLEEFVNLFRSHGRKITPQRREIFRVLAGHTDHPTAEAIWATVYEDQPTMSLKTVYATLHDLVEVGAIQQVDLLPGASRFDPNVSPHHHLICRTCGRIIDIDCGPRDMPSLTAAGGSGYAIEEAEVVYRGRCPDCIAAAAASSDDLKATRRLRQ